VFIIGAFARAAGAHDGDEFAFVHAEGNVADGVDFDFAGAINFLMPSRAMIGVSLMVKGTLEVKAAHERRTGKSGTSRQECLPHIGMASLRSF